MNKQQHTTNYVDAFIQVADDCACSTGVIPPARAGKPTVAALQHEMITKKPYAHTSDDVIFATSAIGRALGKDATKAERHQAREVFFSKGQACLRGSALGKQYGWGIHSDSQARIAIYAVDSAEYRQLVTDPAIRQFKAFRAKRA